MKPILNNVYAFDATKEYKFNFSYDGNQPHKNRLIIKNNQTNVTVYDQTLTTMQMYHTLSANSISNSEVAYNARLIVYDANDVASDISDPIIFFAYLTPTFEFSNITNQQKIESPSVSPILSYSQEQGDLLNSFEIKLYDALKTELFTSNPIYNTSGALTYTFENLEDDTHYFVRAFGETVHHMMLDTGYVEIIVDYIRPSSFSQFEVTNEESLGAVRITCNFIPIGFTTNQGENIVFVNDDAIDLSTDGDYAVINQGFIINDNFRIQINGFKLNANSLIIELQNSLLDKIRILYKEGDINGEVDKAYIKLIATLSNPKISYTTISNLIDIPNEGDVLNIWIQKYKTFYQVILANLSS